MNECYQMRHAYHCRHCPWLHRNKGGGFNMHMSTCSVIKPDISKPASCWRHLLPPPRGGLSLTSCCAFAAFTCFQVTPCILRSLSTCLLDLERFSYGRGRSRSLLPCPAMSTLTSCLACTVRLQHACVRPCTLQIVTSHITTICTALPACHLSCMSN
jgi:hypothetical protein